MYTLNIKIQKNCTFQLEVTEKSFQTQKIVNFNERCSNCDANKEPSENDHQCLTCRNGYYPEPNTLNCWTKNEMYEKGYYFDEKEKNFKKCYADCKTCSTGGNSQDMKCDSCSDEPKKYLTEPHNCISDITHYYYSSEDKLYKKCYPRCYSCKEKGTANKHNCDKCEEIYHFIYNEKGKCISETEKPSNTYIDEITNTYRLCNERYSTCYKGGDGFNHNCKDCSRDSSNNYIYHFIYNETGKCIIEAEKYSNTCLDNTTNTYRLCNESDGFFNKYTVFVIILSIVLLGGLGIVIFLCCRKKQKKDNIMNKYDMQLEDINENIEIE